MLAFHTGQRLTEDLLQMKMGDNMPVSVLMPSRKGLGQCSLALIAYLCQVQNNFMENYSRIRKQTLVPVPITYYVNLSDYISGRFL